jgi:CheY-like chemotaxis protein
MKHLSASTHLTTEQTHPETTSPNPSPNHLANTKSRPCLLVVEDDPSVAGLLNNVLEAWGFHVQVARNGREGLDVVGNHTVDGILLDMHMPVMDGRTMLDELRWLGYRMPVLAMSGGLDLPALRQLLNEGAQGFFLKPFNLQSLKHACQQIFSKGRTI